MIAESRFWKDSKRKQYYKEKFNEIFPKVREILAKGLHIENLDSITPDSLLMDSLGADSLNAIELTMAFEEEFGIEIPDEDARKIRKVSEIVEYLVMRLEKEGKLI